MDLIDELQVFMNSQASAADEIGLNKIYLHQIIHGKKQPGKHAKRLIIDWIEQKKKVLNGNPKSQSTSESLPSSE